MVHFGCMFLCLTRIVNIKYAYVSVYGAFWMYVFVSYSNCEYQVCICKCVWAFWMYVFVSYSNCEYQVCICKCVWCILDVCFCVLLEVCICKCVWCSMYHVKCQYQVCICKCVWCILDVCFCVLLELWISSMHM